MVALPLLRFLHTPLLSALLPRSCSGVTDGFCTAYTLHTVDLEGCPALDVSELGTYIPVLLTVDLEGQIAPLISLPDCSQGTDISALGNIRRPLPVLHPTLAALFTSEVGP